MYRHVLPSSCRTRGREREIPFCVPPNLRCACSLHHQICRARRTVVFATTPRTPSHHLSAMVCNGSCYLKIFEIHLIVIVLVNAFNALHKHTMGKISPTESLARNAVIFISSPSPITCNQHYASTIKQRRQALWYSMTT